ncbi:hypothetical protein RRG08_021127 [Elysia crispata]|uniref:Uncharacterized protein n=1 Tax=Elysia crispata TaxID=231223 RepID=A0AAE1DAA7_9GAST|nr:hypothetical protein RRG08_021127 [Elysia crispata]
MQGSWGEVFKADHKKSQAGLEHAALLFLQIVDRSVLEVCGLRSKLITYAETVRINKKFITNKEHDRKLSAGQAQSVKPSPDQVVRTQEENQLLLEWCILSHEI